MRTSSWTPFSITKGAHKHEAEAARRMAALGILDAGALVSGLPAASISDAVSRHPRSGGAPAYPSGVLGRSLRALRPRFGPKFSLPSPGRWNELGARGEPGVSRWWDGWPEGHAIHPPGANAQGLRGTDA